MMVPYGKMLLWLTLLDQTDEQIVSFFERYTLPIPSKDLLEEYRLQAKESMLSSGTIRRLQNGRYDERDVPFFKKLNLLDVYRRDIEKSKENVDLEKQWHEVYTILDNPYARVSIDCALLCAYSIEDLCQIIPSILHSGCSEKGLKLYVDYFFNSSRMTRVDWRHFLKLTEDLPFVYQRYFAALTKPKEDVLHLVGIPTKPDFSSFLKNVLATSDFKFKYYARLNDPKSDAQARTWAKVGFEAGVRYDKFSSSDVTDFASAVQTEFKMLEPAFDTIDTDMLSQVKPASLEVGKETSSPVPPTEQFNFNDV